MLKKRIGLFGLKELMQNSGAVSEVMGEVLLTGIAVLLVSSIGIFISTYDGATDIPHTQMKEWMGEETDTIYLEHSGGEFLAVKDLEIAVNINGSKHIVYPSSPVYSSLNNSNSWQLGDRIAINTSSEWGVNINKTDKVRVFLVDSPSKQVIQYLEVSSGEEVTPGWIIPATAEDNSGGSASTFDVCRKGDDLYTTYHPPSAVDISKNQVFDFKLNPFLLGVWPDDVPEVKLLIVYKVKDNSCKDINLRIRDKTPSETWINATLTPYTEFTPCTINLPYINNTEDLGNLTVQLVAMENSAVSSEKELYVDYIAIHVN